MVVVDQVDPELAFVVGEDATWISASEVHRLSIALSLWLAKQDKTT